MNTDDLYPWIKILKTPIRRSNKLALPQHHEAFIPNPQLTIPIKKPSSILIDLILIKCLKQPNNPNLYEILQGCRACPALCKCRSFRNPMKLFCHADHLAIVIFYYLVHVFFIHLHYFVFYLTEIWVFYKYFICAFLIILVYCYSGLLIEVFSR